MHTAHTSTASLIQFVGAQRELPSFDTSAVFSSPPPSPTYFLPRFLTGVFGKGIANNKIGFLRNQISFVCVFCFGGLLLGSKCSLHLCEVMKRDEFKIKG